MAGFFYNPQQGNSATAVVLTEAQWRARLTQWVQSVDILEAQLQGAVGVQWFRAPDGDYWVDANGAAPPAFTPTASNAANPNMNFTDNTAWDSSNATGA
jgi:hypothetical protein